MRPSLFRRVIALGLVEVMFITSMLWAAPPETRYPGSPPVRTPYDFEEPPIVKLARALEEVMSAPELGRASRMQPEPEPIQVATAQPPPAPPPILPPPPPTAQLPALGPELTAAFAFGADTFTTQSPNAPTSYTKLAQLEDDLAYEASRGYGYTDLDGLDASPNNRDVLPASDEIYDQFIGAKPSGAVIIFRADIPNGTYRFVAAGGDAKYGNHKTTVRARDGAAGELVDLVTDFRNPNCEFWRVGFETYLPPEAAVAFAPLTDSPTLTITQGYIELHQIVGEGEGIAAGGDLSLVELWRVAEPSPPPADPPPGFVHAFAFGADGFTIDSPNAPGVPYTKIVQDGPNFLFSDSQGFGYADVSGLDTSLNNRGVLAGDDEIYDQFIGAKPAGATIVFKVVVPNGFYRFVAAGGDAKYTNHRTSIRVRDGADGALTTLVSDLRNDENQFFQIGFDGKRPPMTPSVHFLPLSSSPIVGVTKGFLEIHQTAGEGEGIAAGGDLSVLEIWEVEPVPLPEDFVAAFAFGADGFTRQSPNAPIHYTKIVQDGDNFDYDAARGYGYSDLSGLDGSPNNRNILAGDEEIYDQFIGAKPGGSHIVFRIDVPPGDYRFVAAGGDIQYNNHKTSIHVADGTNTPVVLVDDVENPDTEFYAVGFDDKHPPAANGVSFLTEVTSPTLTVTQGYIEVHQLAGAGFASGGDLSLLEIWKAGGSTGPPPTVAIELPLDGAFLTSADVPVRVVYTNATDVQILLDGVDAGLPTGPSATEGTLSVGDGGHDLQVLVSSPAGSASATHMFTVDTEPPVISLDPIPDYVATTPLSVTGTLRDRDPAATVSCPSAVLTLETTASDGVREWSFTCEVPLTEGANVVDITASDSGARQASASANTILDTTPPEITVLSPAPDTYVNVDTIAVSGGVFDDSPVTVVAGSVPANVTGTSFSADGIAIADGSNTILIVATDAAGNTREESITVFFDIDPPTVSLSSPVDGAVTLSPITVTGTVSDPAGVVLVNVNGQAVMVDAGSFTTTLTAGDGPFEIVAEARDTAGNAGIARANVTVDSTPPSVEITSPVDNTITALSPATIEGSVNDATAVALTLNGAPVDAFPIEAPLTQGANALVVAATDAAGNTGTASVDVVLDTIAPNLQVVGPSEGAVLDLPVILTGTVDDATAVTVSAGGVSTIPTGSAWQLELDFLAEQAHALEIIAIDAAGNTASVTRNVFIDFTAPQLDITSPASNILTNAATVDVAGTVGDATAVSVTVNGVPTPVLAGSFVATVDLVDDDNPVRVIATDEGGRSTEASVIVTQDAIAPTVELITPDALSGITNGEVTANVSDNLALDEVVIRVNGVEAGIFAGAPFTVELSVPDGVLPGETVVVSLEARDTAGNVTTTSRGVIVIEDGVIVGQVLSDATSLPVEAATVTLGSRSVETGPDGEYSIPTGEAEVVLLINKDGMTSAERRTSVLSDVGTVPVDVRLTPLGADPVTALSAQGLPALLPLGWSPRAAFHLTTPQTLTATDLADLEVHVAHYSFSLHEWLLVAAGLVPVAGEMSFDASEAGAYAFVVADEELAVPAVGEMLEGVDVAILPASSVAEGSATPSLLPPSGGIARGELTLLSPIPLPSGTVVQAEITERFSLVSGDIASEEIRYEDIVLFRDADGALRASFAIASSLTEELRTPDVVSGEVNLDILAGREAVRGVRAGSRAATIEQGEFRLAVPSGALPEDTAVAIQTFDGFSELALSEPGTEPLAELVVDLSGQRLVHGAELSVAFDGLSPSDVHALVRVVSIHGIPRFEYIALATVQAGRLVAPGVREQGRYLFYRLLDPVGFVSGTTTPPSAIVETAGVPFIARSDSAGHYTALALTGPVAVTATIPRTSLLGSGIVNVIADDTVPLDLTLQGQLTQATVTPVDATLGVSVSTQITITSTTGLDAASTSIIRLLENGTGGTGVPARLALSGSGKTLAVIPEQNLKYETEYTLEAASLADIFGGAVSVPETRFTTRAKGALVVSVDALALSLPNDDGILFVTGSGLPPATTVLIVNSGNGIVLSLTVDNDGNLAGELPATISDRILVTLTDPAGTSVSFEKSKFTAPDGTTGVGPGGGTVEGPGGVELRIPEGALERGVTLKIESFDETFLPPDQKPDLPDSNFGAGLKVTSADMPTFEKEVDLAFPKPAAAPDGAFYYVYRKFETETGVVQWETIDHAFVEDDKVVTASYPFGGYTNSFSSLGPGGLPLASGVSVFMLVWNLAPAGDSARTGTITGKVLRSVFGPTATAPSFVPIAGVPVFGLDSAGQPLEGVDNSVFAISQQDGTYTLWDETFRDGTVRVRASVDGATQEATAFGINVENDGESQLRFYENVATANLTFPPKVPTPPPPSITVAIFRKKADGTRERTKGLVVEDDVLVIGLVTKDVVQRATINGGIFGLRSDAVDPNIDLVLDRDFVPGRVGTFTLEVAALAADGRSVSEKTVFRSIAAGGSNNTVLNDDAPAVITSLTVPRNNANTVSTDVFPRVVFTEPVTNVPGNVQLLDSNGAEVPITLSGVDPDGSPIPNVSSVGARITSLTIQPVSGLRFNERYELHLNSAIVDLDIDALDAPAPKPLDPFQTAFETFGPEPLGGSSERFGSAGMAVVGDRAYLVENHLHSGTLRVFDIADPVEPVEFPGAQSSFAGRPVDIDAAPGMVVIATGPTHKSRPSNLYVVDVSTDGESRWIGAASVASSAVDGFVERVDLLDGLAYVLTGRKGIQVVQLQQAIDLFEDAIDGELFSPEYFSVVQKLNAPGLGFGQTAVGQAIPLVKSGGAQWVQRDLSARRIQGDVWAGTTGEAPLLMVNAITREMMEPVPVEVSSSATGSLTFGSAIELASVGSRELALVGGWRKFTSSDFFYGLGVVDVADPKAPASLAVVELPLDSEPTDILVVQDIAIVAAKDQAALVNLASPDSPVFAGTINMVGGVLALTDSNLLLSTARSVFGEDPPESGINAAALGRVGLVALKGQNPFGVDNDNFSEVTLDLDFRVAPADLEVETAEAELLENGDVVRVLELVRDGNTWNTTIQEGSEFNPDADYFVNFVVNRGLDDETASKPKRLRPARLEFIDTEEVADETALDLLPLFNPTPRVKIAAVADPGAGRRVTATITGEVISSLAPIAVVAIDGRFEPVTATSSGSDGTGPFSGTFSTKVQLGPQESLILAHVANALGNLGSDSVVISPIVDGDGQIVGRQSHARFDISPQEQLPTEHFVRIEVNDRGIVGDTARVAIDAGFGAKFVELRRVGDAFRSEPVLVVPDNLVLPPDATEEMEERLLRTRMGARTRVIYAGNVQEDAAVVGALLVSGDALQPVSLIEPSDQTAARQQLKLAVGMSGASGATLQVSLDSLREDLQPATPTSPVPFSQQVELRRQSSDPELAGYNLYLSDLPVLPVYPDAAVEFPGALEHGVVAGTYLRLLAPTGDSVEPVGIPADRVKWVVVSANPIFKTGLPDPATETTRLEFFDIVVSAELLSPAGSVPGMLMGLSFDSTGDIAEETSSVIPVVPVGDEFEQVAFPARTEDDGKTYFRIRLDLRDTDAVTAADALKGLAVSPIDSAGGTVIELLETLQAGGEQAQQLEALLIKSGLAPRFTPLVRGKAVAGAPQGLGALGGLIARELLYPILTAHPSFATVVLTIKQGFEAAGTFLTSELLEEYAYAVMAGVLLGAPLGFLHAGVESLRLIRNTVLLWDLLVMAYQGVAKIDFGKLTWKVVDGVIQFVVSDSYREEIGKRIDEFGVQMIKVAEIATDPAVLKFVTVQVGQALYPAYDEAIGAYLPTLTGFPRGSEAEELFLTGFMLGHILGFLTEIFAELAVGAVFAAGALSFVVGMIRLSKAKVLVSAIQFIGHLKLTKLRDAGKGQLIGKTLLFFFQFVSGLDDARLLGVLSKVNKAEDAERILLAVQHFGSKFEEFLSDGRYITPGLDELIRVLKLVDEPEEVAVMLGKLLDPDFRTGGRVLFVGLDELEDVALALDRLAKISKGGINVPGRIVKAERLLEGIDAILRNVDDVGPFLTRLANGGDEAAAALAKLTPPPGGTGVQFASVDDAVAEFLATIATRWDGEAFATMEALIARWATTTPPPLEAVFDVITIVAKYGRRAAVDGLDGGENTVRIVQQLQRIPANGDDALRQLIALEKAFFQPGSTNHPGLNKVNLDWLARNMELSEQTGRGFGRETDALEHLLLVTRINSSDDLVGGPQATVFRDMQRFAGKEASSRLARQVKSVLAARELVRFLQAIADVEVETRSASKFIDVVATFRTDTPLVIRRLDDAGELVDISQTVSAGTRVTFEVKAYQVSSWSFPDAIPTAREEVLTGFRFVDPAGSGTGDSFLAVSNDIMGNEAVQRQILNDLRNFDDPFHSGRESGLFFLELGAAPGTGGYEDAARGLVRQLAP